jgi:hypothetical protein
LFSILYANMEALAFQSGVELPKQSVRASDGLHGSSSELEICMEPTEIGLKEGVACLQRNNSISTVVVDMYNQLSTSPRLGFVVFTFHEIFSISTNPGAFVFPELNKLAHTLVLPIHLHPEHIITAVLRRVTHAGKSLRAEVSIFDSNLANGWHRPDVRASVPVIVQRVAEKWGMDPEDVDGLLAGVNRWEAWSEQDEAPSCGLFQMLTTQAVSLGLNPSQVTVEIVNFFRKYLYQACLSARNAAAPNNFAIQEAHQAMAIKMLQQYPTQVLTRSC